MMQHSQTNTITLIKPKTLSNKHYNTQTDTTLASQINILHRSQTNPLQH